MVVSGALLSIGNGPVLIFGMLTTALIAATFGNPRLRPLSVATAFALGIPALGLSARIPYLGVSTVDSHIGAWLLAGPVMCLLVAWASMELRLSTGVRKHQRHQGLPNAALLTASLGASSLLFVMRFVEQRGIPVLQGDASRLVGVANTNPYLSLLAAGLAVGAALASTRFGSRPRYLNIALAGNFVIVVGTGSRLLLLALVIVQASRISDFVRRILGNKGRWRRRLSVLLVMVVAIATVRFVYSARTSDSVTQIYATRVARDVDGVPRVVAGLVGTGAVVSARNGPAVVSRLDNSDIRPDRGFVAGALLFVLHQGVDPERAVTKALGLDVRTVGATAVPLFGSAGLDGGLGFVFILGFAQGLGYVWLISRRSTNPLAIWWAFGVAMSAYGSYLLSTQFLVILAAGAALSSGRWAKSRRPGAVLVS